MRGNHVERHYMITTDMKLSCRFARKTSIKQFLENIASRDRHNELAFLIYWVDTRRVLSKRDVVNLPERNDQVKSAHVFKQSRWEDEKFYRVKLRFLKGKLQKEIFKDNEAGDNEQPVGDTPHHHKILQIAKTIVKSVENASQKKVMRATIDLLLDAENEISLINIPTPSELAQLEKSLSRKRYDRFVHQQLESLHPEQIGQTDTAEQEKTADFHATIDERATSKSRFRGSTLELFHPNFIEMMDKDIEKEKETNEITDRMQEITGRHENDLSPQRMLERYSSERQLYVQANRHMNNFTEYLHSAVNKTARSSLAKQESTDLMRFQQLAGQQNGAEHGPSGKKKRNITRLARKGLSDVELVSANAISKYTTLARPRTKKGYLHDQLNPHRGKLIQILCREEYRRLDRKRHRGKFQQPVAFDQRGIGRKSSVPVVIMSPNKLGGSSAFPNLS